MELEGDAKDAFCTRHSMNCRQIHGITYHITGIILLKLSLSDIFYMTNIEDKISHLAFAPFKPL